MISNERGAGILDVMMGFAIVAIVSTLSLQLLNSSNEQAAMLRKFSMTKKSFGAAEQVLINQRQCRCNFGNLSPLNPVGFPINVASTATISIKQIKTFWDDDGCGANSSGIAPDLVLADTASSADVSIRSSDIYLSQFKILIPQMLYRATLAIVPTWGAPVLIPLLLNTKPDVGGNAIVQICGVDRDS